MVQFTASVPARKMKSVCSSFVIASLLALAILLFPQHVQARVLATNPTLTVSIGFSNDLRPGNWVPVQVKLSGGNFDFNGRVAIDVPINTYQTGSTIPSNTYQASLALPAGGQKQITLYVPFPNNFQGQNQSMTVKLIDAGGTTVNTQVVNGQVVNNNDAFVGILSNQNRGFGGLSSIQLPSGGGHVDTVMLDATTFPTQAAVLKNFDLLVLDNFTTGALSHDQLNALQQWVTQGGSLALVGGPEWQSTLGPLASSLLPVSISSITTLPANTPLLPVGGPSRGGPNDAQDPISVPSSVTASVATPQTGSLTLLSAGSTPLLVQATKGQGKVFYLAFDPALAPLTTWTGASDLWASLIYRSLGDRILTMSMQGSGQNFSPLNASGIDGTLQSLLPNTFPAIWLVLILLAAYLLIIGPIRLLIVRRLKKRAWSWRIILSSIVVFSLLSYGLVLVQKGTSIISDTVSIIQLGASNGSNTTAHFTTMVGVFVPNQGDFRVHIPGSNLTQPSVNPYGFNGLPQQQSDTVTSGTDASDVELQGVNTWTLRSVSAEQDGQLSGGITSQLSVKGSQLTGTVTNTLPYTLNDAYVLIGNQILHVGTLAAGQSQQVSLDLSDTQSQSQQYQPGQPMLVGQIAADKNMQNFPYNGTNQGAQNEDQRHVSILAMLSGQGGYNYIGCGPGVCAVPAMGGGIGIKSTSSYMSVVVMSGGGGFYKFGGVTQGGRDPLLLPNVPATLIGWTNQAPSASTGVTINGNHIAGLQETLVQAPLSVDLSQGLAVPDTLIPGRLVSANTTAGLINNIPGVYSLQNNENMTFEYSLPTSFAQQHHSISLTEPQNLTQFSGKASTGTGTGDVNSLNVHVYNWQSGQWDSFSFANFTLAISDTHAYTDTTGRMLLQLACSDPNNNGIPFIVPQLQTQGGA